MMKFCSARFMLLVILFVILVMVIYFALIPHLFFQHSLPHKYSQNYSALHHKVAAAPLLLSVPETATTPKPPPKQQHQQQQNESGGSLVVMEKDSDALLTLVRKMHRKRGVVLFTMINDAFLDFASSWCCNTGAFSNSLHQHTLFLTTDRPTGEALLAAFPNVSVVALSVPDMGGAQQYSRAGYVRMMTERTRFILRLLETGVPLLLFEVDCVWLADPLPHLLPLQSKADIVATRVSGKDVTAGGFLFLIPTEATLQFWRELTRMMDKLFSDIRSRQKSAYVSEALNDQEFFSRLARKKYAGIRIQYLESSTFPDGKWYSLPERERQKSHPVIINNNWVLGTDAKRNRAKAFGHWFWDQSQKRCNSSAVSHLFH